MPENFLDNVLASSVVLLVFLVLMGVVFTVWSYVKMRKKRQYFEKVHKELAPGQEAAPAVRRHAAKCNRRLQDRREAMAAAGKRPVVANCATAREMACWVWAIAGMAAA